jgi:MFS superfamily sulfate permease-like transporter
MFLLFLSPGLIWYCIRGPRCAAGEFKLFQHKKILIRWQRYETNQNTIWDTRPKQIAEKKVKEIVMFKTCQRFKKKIKKYNVQRRKLSKLGISLQSM